MIVKDRITDYLAKGGLWNPEQMEHDKVRDLLIDCRDTIEDLQSALKCQHCGQQMGTLFAGHYTLYCHKPHCVEIECVPFA